MYPQHLRGKKRKYAQNLWQEGTITHTKQDSRLWNRNSLLKIVPDMVAENQA